MNKKQITVLFAVLAFQSPAALAQWEIRNYPGSNFEGPAFVFEEVAEDIYQALGTGNVMVGSNTAIIINDDDVVIVDSNISPASAAALAAELKVITPKPIRYVINTHFHFDHAHGNQIYPADVEVIGHEYTYEMLVDGSSMGRTYQDYTDWIASEPGGAEGQKGLIPTPPTATLSDKMTLFRGDREIQLIFFGRGHTGGDVVVYLPAEKILFTGDLLLEGVPFMGDGFPSDWIDTLEGIKALEFDIVVPGHGRPFAGRDRIDLLQKLLGDIWDKASASCDNRLSAEQAAGQIDLTDHATAYPEITGPGAEIATVKRIYELRGCEP
jgi:cyclase